jgi:hypothetical protein
MDDQQYLGLFRCAADWLQAQRRGGPRARRGRGRCTPSAAEGVDDLPPYLRSAVLALLAVRRAATTSKQAG